MGDTPKCNTHLYTEAEIKATAFDVLNVIANENLDFSDDDVNIVRFAFATLVDELIKEV